MLPAKREGGVEGKHWELLQSWKQDAVEYTVIDNIRRFRFSTADADDSASSSPMSSSNSADSNVEQLSYYRHLIERITSDDFEACPMERLFEREDAQY